MLAHAVRGVSVNAAAYAFELKWDGCRAHLCVVDGELTIWNRRGQERTGQWPELHGLVEQLAGRDVYVDGEIVAFGGDGRPCFDTLRRRLGRKPATAQRLARTHPVCLSVF